MTNIKKIGLSALAGALAMTSAHAGSLSVTGAMEVSYTKGSGKHTTGNPLGQNNELTFAASTELDNGVTVAYKNTATDTALANDSELVFGNILGGTLAFQSTGSPLDGIDNKMPTAFNDAEGAVGSIADVSGANGDFGIRYTLSDVLGSGIKLDYNYVPKHGTGDATGDGGPGGDTAGAQNNQDAHDITLTGAVPGVEGLSVGAGYSKKNYDYKAAGTPVQTQESGTAYATYAYGPVTVGYQVGAVGDTGLGGNAYKNTYMGISYAISDDLSVAYNNTVSRKTAGAVTFNSLEQEWDNISLAYSMGGMTIGVSDSDCSNCSYTSGQKQSETIINLTVAF
ncbi:MAG: porin [Pelagibacteraceae bacterium]|nr:porin [Pelagibacteraceae bacterium]